MSQELAVRDGGLMQLAGEMVRAGLAPKGLDTPQKLAIVMQAGAELNLPPMTAARCMYVIQGRANPFGDLPAALAFRSGQLDDYEEKCERVGEGDKADLVATVTVKRKGLSRPISRSFSWRDAVRAGLAGKDTYKAYPSDMLISKARLRALRAAFPDYLLNIADDIEDEPAAPGGGGSVTQLPALEAPAEQATTDRVMDRLFTQTEGQQAGEAVNHE